MSGQGGHVSTDMFLGLNLAARTEVRIFDASLFQACWEATSSSNLMLSHVLLQVMQMMMMIMMMMDEDDNDDDG